MENDSEKEAMKTRRQEHMRILTDEIKKAGHQLLVAKINLFSHLASLRDEKKYAEYIIFGTSLIEFLLEKLLLAHEHSINFSLLVADMMAGTISPNEVRVISNKKKSAGTQLADLKKFFGFHSYYEKTSLSTLELIEKRNEVIHDLIEKYGGDLEIVNKVLEPYVMRKPVETLFNELLKVQERLALDNKVKNEVAQKMKPKVETNNTGEEIKK